MIPIKNEKNNRLFISDFEDIVRECEVISYNENLIEIPGVMLIVPEQKASFSLVALNPGIDIIKISEEEFLKMHEIISHIHEVEDRIVVSSPLMLKRKHVINLEKLVERAVLVKISDDTVLVNNYVFTSNLLEFHGDGMFTSKHAYNLGIEDMAVIIKRFEAEEPK